MENSLEKVETLIIDWLKSDNENTTYLANQICILLDVTGRFCKECGFVEPCIGWMRDWAKDVCLGKHEPSHHHESSCNAILYQQAFRFFRDKYNLLGSVDYSNRLKWYYVIREFITSDILPNLNTSSKGEFEYYEEAELECLKKLIEIVKEK